MPDLTIEHIRTCKQNTFFTTKVTGSNGRVYEVTYCESKGQFYNGRGQYQYEWFCTCPDFNFRKNKNCKHIQEAKTKKCSWNWEAWMGSHAEANPDNTCPECGGETEVIKVGV